MNFNKYVPSTIFAVSEYYKVLDSQVKGFVNNFIDCNENHGNDLYSNKIIYLSNSYNSIVV